MTISRFGGALAVCGAIMAVIGFALAGDFQAEDTEVITYGVGGWIGVGIAVVGFCVWMATPRGRVED
jgi:hypothetical protein